MLCPCVMARTMVVRPAPEGTGAGSSPPGSTPLLPAGGGYWTTFSRRLDCPLWWVWAEGGGFITFSAPRRQGTRSHNSYPCLGVASGQYGGMVLSDVKVPQS